MAADEQSPGIDQEPHMGLDFRQQHCPSTTADFGFVQEAAMAGSDELRVYVRESWSRPNVSCQWT